MEKLTSGSEKLGLQLSARQIEQFQTYYEELVNWNEKFNLTAITDYEEVQIRHFLDSLTVVQGLEPDMLARIKSRLPLSVIDVGTGAGLPGIPLKIAFPSIRLALIESIGKKARFLQHMVNTLGLVNVDVLIGRAEEFAHNADYREKFDLAVARALAKLPALAELTLPFCRVGGRVIAPKQGYIEAEVNSAMKAIKLLGGKLAEMKPVTVEGLERERYLVIIDKVKPTLQEYPRRPGIPGKSPL